MAQEEVFQEQQHQEVLAPPQEPVRQALQREESDKEFIDMFSQIFNVPKDVVAKALNKEESLQRAQALVQLMQQLSQLPKEIRKALAPFIAGMVSSDDDELKRLTKWMMVMRALNDPTSKLFIELLLEERRRVYEMQQQLVQLLLKEYLGNGAQKEVRQLVQQVVKDPLDDLAERLEKLQKAAQILGFQRVADERPRSVLETIEEITKLADVLRKFGFDVKPAVAEQELKRIREEAYRQGLQEGVKKAEQFTELAKTALEKLGPSLSKLMDALADYLKTRQQHTV